MRALEEMSWVDAEEDLRKAGVALLPVGSVEQHGPQNPLGTDYVIAWELAKEAARKTGALLLPPLPYGVSEHHSHFPGTVWIDEDSFQEYVYCIIRSLVKWGVRKVVVVNGHGGNLTALLRVSHRAKRDLGALVVVYQWWTAVSKSFRDVVGEEGLGHAGALETALVAYLRPDWVRLERAVDEKPSKKFAVPAYAYWYTRELSQSGVFGVSTRASRDLGRSAFEASVDALVRLVEEVRRYPIES